MEEGLWKQLNKEIKLDDELKELHKDVDCRFKGSKLKRVKQLLDSRDKENIVLVEELIKVTKPYKTRERNRSNLVVYTGTEGMKKINEAIKDEFGKIK